MADESSLIVQHGRDIIVIMLFIASTLLTWILFILRKNFNEWIKWRDKIENHIYGMPGKTESGFEHRLTVIETICKARRENGYPVRKRK